jgi:hypothetical protein
MIEDMEIVEIFVGPSYFCATQGEAFRPSKGSAGQRRSAGSARCAEDDAVGSLPVPESTRMQPSFNPNLQLGLLLPSFVPSPRPSFVPSSRPRNREGPLAAGVSMNSHQHVGRKAGLLSTYVRLTFDFLFEGKELLLGGRWPGVAGEAVEQPPKHLLLFNFSPNLQPWPVVTSFVPSSRPSFVPSSRPRNRDLRSTYVRLPF